MVRKQEQKKNTANIGDRIKDTIKKIFSAKIGLGRPLQSKKKKDVTLAKEAPGSREMAVQETKFFTGHVSARPVRHTATDVPGGYGEDRIVIQVRDPWWVHSYWEVTLNTIANLKKDLGDLFYRSKRILRVYDVTGINFNGSNANRYFDIEVPDYSSNWYIDTAGPGRSWCVEYGLLLPDNRFIMVMRSNVTSTPLDGPSWITDEEWMIPDDLFARLYGLGIGFGRSSPVGKMWQERLKHQITSGGLFSVSSPFGKRVEEHKFWLVANTELIVYGATEPDAKVTVQNKPINLRPDGTFTLRFALPEGKQVIPVRARSNDGIDERTITPIVNRETK